MPYDKLSDLPESVQDNLPHHAQEIYRSAFNNPWSEYDHDEARSHRSPGGPSSGTMKRMRSQATGARSSQVHVTMSASWSLPYWPRSSELTA